MNTGSKKLFDRLHLKGRNDHKLRAADVLQISKHSLQSNESCAEDELIQTFIQKLLMMDYRARYITVRDPNEQDQIQQIYDDSSKCECDIFEDMRLSNEGTSQSGQIHSMDVQMAVFHCADGFLKQLMVTKLSQCQYALPLLVPDPFTRQIEFPLWTFRQITKSWKIRNTNNEIISQTQTIYKAETPMVFFFRLGSVSSSKSQLMNSLISDKHNTFFHRNCPGSSRTRVLMDGVVEITWFCPSGTNDDKFTGCVAFCNLHGDAGDHEKQLQILTDMASVNVVLLPRLDRSMIKVQELYKDVKPLICLFTENASTLIETRKGKYKIGLKDRNQSDVSEELRRAINACVSEPPSTFRLEDVSKHSDIRVDMEDDNDCRRGRETAKQMMSLLKKENLAETKDSFLPHQGKLWHQWSQKNKELHRPQGDELENEISQKQELMKKIRERQHESDISEFMKLFINEMSSVAANKMFFTKWLSIVLDEYTSADLSALHHKYNEKWSKVLQMKGKHDKSDQLKAEQTELEKISEEVQNATFGLEHIMREIGQIYESCSSVKKNKKDPKDVSSLASLAAQMMISGFPLELMDGDAAHVPVIWISAVLDQLIQKLGDQRVFVLSVLGLQSSGKSTMLNTMFGLQFAVSAGRCTRGAFMQLIKVSDEMKTQMNSGSDEMKTQINSGSDEMKTQMNSGSDEMKTQINSGSDEMKTQMNSGSDEMKTQMNSGSDEMKTQMNSGSDEMKTQMNSGSDEMKTQMNSGSDEMKTQMNSGSDEMKTQMNSGSDEMKTQMNSGSDEMKTQMNSGSDEMKTQMNSGSDEMKTQMNSGSDEMKTQMNSGSDEMKTQMNSGSDEMKTQMNSGSDEMKTQMNSGSDEMKTQMNSGSDEMKTQMNSGSDEMKTQMNSGSDEMKTQMNSGSDEMKTQMNSGSDEMKTQMNSGSDEMKTQMNSGSDEMKTQMNSGSDEMKTQMNSGSDEMKTQMNSGSDEMKTQMNSGSDEMKTQMNSGSDEMKTQMNSGSDEMKTQMNSGSDEMKTQMNSGSDEMKTQMNSGSDEMKTQMNSGSDEMKTQMNSGSDEMKTQMNSGSDEMKTQMNSGSDEMKTQMNSGSDEMKTQMNSGSDEMKTQMNSGSDEMKTQMNSGSDEMKTQMNSGSDEMKTQMNSGSDEMKTQMNSGSDEMKTQMNSGSDEMKTQMNSGSDEMKTQMNSGSDEMKTQMNSGSDEMKTQMNSGSDEMKTQMNSGSDEMKTQMNSGSDEMKTQMNSGSDEMKTQMNSGSDEMKTQMNSGSDEMKTQMNSGSDEMKTQMNSGSDEMKTQMNSGSDEMKTQMNSGSDEMKTQMKIDYILVVDTEGLRALELSGRSTRHHDNELATFVVGLGNLTLINILGENPSEMQDILQIVVQAFLRMNKVRLNPSCVFVHQNVSDVTAGEKNMEGRRRLQETLDEMTKLAAKEEVCDVERFGDVIRFDVQKDVKYFAQLWEGSPPMAPPNPNYCENIQDLKKTIMTHAEISHGTRLKDLKVRINDLWEALLNERFVFSFRNSLEISAYRKLETKYSKWSWRLRSAMLETENKLHNQIENEAIHEVTETDLHRELKKTSEEVKKSVSEFFEKDADANILIQWKTSFDIKIKELQESIVRETKRKLNEILKQRDLKKEIDAQRTHQENTLFEKSKELALKHKDKANDEETLKEEFDLFWKEWMKIISTDTPKIRDIDIMRDMREILSNIYESINADHRKGSRDIFSVQSYPDYVQLKKNLLTKVQQMLGYGLSEDEAQIRSLVTDVVQQTDKRIQSFNISEMGYSISYIQQLIDYIKTRVTEHEEGQIKYVFKSEFFMDLVFSICKRANKVITGQHRMFKEANDPEIYVKKKKEEYYSIFQKYCHGATSAAIFGEIICQKLKEPIEQSVYKKTAREFANDMRSDCPSLNGNRSNLEKHILIKLAKEEDFDKYMDYIHNPRDHFKSFIRAEVSRYISDKFSVRVLPKMMKRNIELLQQKIKEAAHQSTEHVQVNRDVGLWLKRFTQQLSDELIFSEKDLSGVNHDDVDFKLLEDVIKKELPAIMSGISSGFNTNTFPAKLDPKFRPDELLIDGLCQCCWVQCPFCSAICTNTIENHDEDHSAVFHGVRGVNGTTFRGTTNLSVWICTTSVASSDRSFYSSANDKTFPYSEYRKAKGDYAKWSITPDLSELPYWKWFVCRFKKHLEKHYDKTFDGSGKIPPEWRKLSKQDAIKSLIKKYN